MSTSFRIALVVVSLLIFAPAAAAGVTPGQPFPSNLRTVGDPTQVTGLHVSLPSPNCATHASDCADIGVLNTLDGFSLQPRISIPFNGAVDLSTVSSSTVFLANAAGDRIGINQVVWEPAPSSPPTRRPTSSILHVEPDQLLEQDTPYVLVVTDGLKDADGSELDAAQFRRSLTFDLTHDPAEKAYRKALLGALHWSGIPLGQIVDAALFTTQSVTAISEKIRRQLDASSPAPVSFTIGTLGERAAFPFSSVLGLVVNRQVGTAPTFATSTIPAAIPVVPGAIGTVAFGRFSSPDYETSAKVIPAYGTASGTPAPLGTNDLYVNVYLPSGTEPAGGWPVAIFGHGFTDSKQGAPIAVASLLGANGVATVAINVVGHGGGPLGTITVLRSSGAPVVVPAGGRGIDQDGNGTIDSTEGVNAVGPAAIVGNRDGLRQTTVDLMQLVREIQVGVDVNGDGTRDLDPAKISYAGQSFGGIYGSQFMALEPAAHAGVLNVPGGSITEIARLSPSFRSLIGLALINHSPSLYNVAPDPTLQNFVENIPFRNQPIVVDTIPGASAIQEYLDRLQWAQESGDAVAYAPHLRAEPLTGISPKAVIIQFAKGDKTVPNPTASALIRAGGLADRATYFRNDLAFATVPGYTVKNPHTFLTNLGGASTPFAVAAQQQLATFLASAGAVTIDPDGAGPFFETPIAGPLPETLNFIP